MAKIHILTPAKLSEPFPIAIINTSSHNDRSYTCGGAVPMLDC